MSLMLLMSNFTYSLVYLRLHCTFPYFLLVASSSIVACISEKGALRVIKDSGSFALGIMDYTSDHILHVRCAVGVWIR